MVRTTCDASWPNVASCGRASAWRSCFATKAPTSSTAAPTTTGTNGGTNPASAPPNTMPKIWASAPPACESPLPCSRSLPDSTSGIAADFTASTTRTHACTASNPTISAAVAKVLPSVVSEPSGTSTASATTTTTTAVATSAHHTTRRRGNRSMNTPMNGEISVYGT